MNNRLIRLALILFTSTFVFQIQAAEEENSSAAKVTTKVAPIVAKEEKPKFTGKFLIQTASTINSADPISASGLYLGSIGYSVPQANGKISAGLTLGYQRQYSYQGETTLNLYGDKMPEGQAWDWVDPSFSASRSFDKWKGLDTITAAIRGSVTGLSKASQRKEQNGSIGPSIGYSTNLAPAWKPLSAITASQSLDYRFVWYRYRTQYSGKINSPHVFMVYNNLDAALSEKLTMSLFVSYVHMISFQDVGRSNIGAGLELGYSVMDKGSLALGVSNGSDGLSVDGMNRELNLMNPTNATAYFNMELRI